MKKGDIVTVVFVPSNGKPPILVKAEVTAVHESIEGFVCEPFATDQRFTHRYGHPVLGRLFIEEGTMWCHGWNGPAVRALCAATALL